MSYANTSIIATLHTEKTKRSSNLIRQAGKYNSNLHLIIVCYLTYGHFIYLGRFTQVLDEFTWVNYR